VPRAELEQLEHSDLDLPVALTWLVRDEIGIDEDELNAARRRAMFVLAAGGDPHRELDVDSVAAERLAALTAEAGGLAAVTAALDALRDDPELAWRSLALALLADELAGE
jgi:hypothetical protein